MNIRGLDINRRSFLASSAALLVVNTLPKVCFGQEADKDNVFTNASLGAYASGQLTFAALQAVKGSLFMLVMPDGQANYMTLQSVTEYKQAKSKVLDGKAGLAATKSLANTPVVESFTAVFAKDDTLVPQGSYVVDHGRLGRFAVFLVPGPSTPGQMTMVATFGYMKTPLTAPKPIVPLRQLTEL